MSDHQDQDIADVLSGIMTVVESHATVAGFWMGEHAKARLLADDLQAKIYQLQEKIEAFHDRDENKELIKLRGDLRMSEQEIDLLREKIAEMKVSISDQNKRHSALNQSLADRKNTLEDQLEAAKSRISEAETEIAAARNAASIMSEKVSAPGQEKSEDAGWLSTQNSLLKENIRKIGMYIKRVDDQFTENPDRALRSLSAAQKLVEQSASVGGKS